MKNQILTLASNCRRILKLLFGSVRITEHSEIMFADGSVRHTIYIPAHIELRPNSMLWGYDSFSNPMLGYSNRFIPDEYQVTIDWEHGPTILETIEDYRKFENHEGEQVGIVYFEVYRAIYDRSTGGLIKRTLTDYEIVDISF